MKLFILAALTTLSACGYSSKDNEVVGQIKKVIHQTPIICPDRHDVDLSLGVMRGGVGSMSSQDLWFTADGALVEKLKQAADQGTLVKITYDVKRFTWCQSDHIIHTVEQITSN